jgi:hypothetical protein
MRYIIDKQLALSRAPDGPLAAYLGPFAQWQSAQGYPLGSVHRQIRLAADFSHWLEQQGVALRYVTCDHPSRYLRERARRVRPCSRDAAELRHLLDFLRRVDVVAAEKIAARRLTPAEAYAHEYAQYLRDARALARTTIIAYMSFIRGFLTDRFGTGPVRLALLNARDVVRFVQRQARQLHLKRANTHHGITFLPAVCALPEVGRTSQRICVRGCRPMRRILPAFAFLTLSVFARSTLAQTDSQWLLEQSTLTYHVSHPLHQVEGVSHAARGKAVCHAGLCDFLIAVPVKSFDSGDSNRDLHMLQVTRGGEFPMVSVRTRLPESAPVSSTIHADLEVQFAGQTAQYKQVPFQLSIQGDQAKLSGTIPATLTDFKIDPPSLLTVPIKNEIPIHVEMTWRKQK